MEVENLGDEVTGGMTETSSSVPGYVTGDDGKERPSPELTALVKQIIGDIKAREKHFDKQFKRMKSDMEFAKRGADKGWGEDNYVVNLAQRHVQQRVASLYAKNPTAVAKRRKTVDYKVWDGKATSLQQAQQIIAMLQSPDAIAMGMQNPMAAMAMMPQLEQAMMLIADVQEAQQRIMMLNKLGQTMECLFRYYINEDVPTFKLQAKQLVRRVVTTGIGYVKLGFQRIMGRSTAMQTQIADFRSQVAHAERLSQELAEKKLEPDSAEVEELKLAMQALQAKKDVLIREGLVFDFPRATAIIPDLDTMSIKGWIGTRRVAQKFLFSPAKVREIYGVDVKEEYTGYNKNGAVAKKGKDFCLVYEDYDKDSGLMYTVCDGYCDFLEEPAAPPVELEQFFPFFPLSFNDLEDEDDIFPPSDISLIRHACMETNRGREGLRQHRRANQPKYAVVKGRLDDADKDTLANAVAHQVLEFNAMNPGDKIGDIVQKFEHAGIDPALYDVGPQMDDILRAVGSQEANLGPTSGATATESSIAEGSRLSSQASAIDDLDDMLSLLARAASQVMLAELNQETVNKIAGPGAVWPSMSEEEIADELWLEIAAGSSGRPNKAMELQNLQTITPMLIQVPGISPNWLAKQFITRLDDHVDLDEALLDGMPSITAMNGMQQATANAGGAPEEQGGEGSSNAPKPAANKAGSGPGGQSGAMPAYG